MGHIFSLLGFLSSIALADITIQYKNGSQALIYKKDQVVVYELCPSSSVTRRGCSGRKDLFSTSFEAYRARINSFYGISERQYATGAGLELVTQKIETIQNLLENEGISGEELEKAINIQKELRLVQDAWRKNQEEIFRFLDLPSSLTINVEFQFNKSQVFQSAFYDVWYLAPHKRIARVAKRNGSFFNLRKDCLINGVQMEPLSGGNSLVDSLDKSGLIGNEIAWTENTTRPYYPGHIHNEREVFVLARNKGTKALQVATLVVPEHGGPGHVTICLVPFGESGEMGSQGKTRATHTGAVFRLRTDHPALGESWEDPRGFVWSALRPARTQETAVSDCKAVGTRLPTMDDYKAIRKDLGFGTTFGYKPQILKGIDEKVWTSSTYYVNPNAYYSGVWAVFAGTTGEFGAKRSYDYDPLPYRCVLEPKSSAE